MVDFLVEKAGITCYNIWTQDDNDGDLWSSKKEASSLLLPGDVLLRQQNTISPIFICFKDNLSKRFAGRSFQWWIEDCWINRSVDQLLYKVFSPPTHHPTMVKFRGLGKGSWNQWWMGILGDFPCCIIGPRLPGTFSLFLPFSFPSSTSPSTAPCHRRGGSIGLLSEVVDKV